MRGATLTRRRSAASDIGVSFQLSRKHSPKSRPGEDYNSKQDSRMLSFGTALLLAVSAVGQHGLERHKSMEGPSGIGVAEFAWYQKNVHLVPCTWAEQLRIGERELERSLAYLELERQRNAALPPLRAAADLAELARRQKAAVAYFFDFLRRSEIFTVPGYMRRDSEVGGFVPPERRDCFTGSPTVIPCRSSATVSTGW